MHCIKFLPIKEESDIGNDNYLYFKWNKPDCNVVFSVTRKGNGAMCHFKSDKKGLRKLKQALNEWCEFCFWLFDWCEMIIATIRPSSVKKLAEKCEFKKVLDSNNLSLYIRSQL